MKGELKDSVEYESRGLVCENLMKGELKEGVFRSARACYRYLEESHEGGIEEALRPVACAARIAQTSCPKGFL